MEILKDKQKEAIFLRELVLFKPVVLSGMHTSMVDAATIREIFKMTHYSAFFMSSTSLFT